MPTTTSYEEKEIRCPRLGGEVTFGYCSREASGNPCYRALFCWSPYFQVEVFFKEKLGEEAFHECFDKTVQPKLVTLVDLIEKARNTTKEER